MTRKGAFIGVFLLSAGLLLAAPRAGWTESGSDGAKGGTDVAPDNTKMNKQDRSAEKVTADQQKESAPDREMTKMIRKKVVKDKTLSTYAHNVKIITRGGKVMLKGPVRSEEEKTKVQDMAGQIAGSDNVRSELQVAPKKSK